MSRIRGSASKSTTERKSLRQSKESARSNKIPVLDPKVLDCEMSEERMNIVRKLNSSRELTGQQYNVNSVNKQERKIIMNVAYT